MRKEGLRGCIRGRRKRTTRRNKHAVPAEDSVRREFAAAAPNKLWTADITYVDTKEGFLYLAFVLDVYSRRLVGWAMESHLRTELVLGALEMALWRRKPAPGCDPSLRPGRSVHSPLVRQAARRSRHRTFDGRAGCALENAVSESCVATLKTELVSRLRFPSREVAKTAIFEYLEAFYNRTRIHSSLGYRSPAGFEEDRMRESTAA